MSAYYNEIDAHCAQWLRNLIAADLIAAGDVDERDICDVRPDDLRGYAQCHFFAGIGVWSYALRLAGWTDDQRIWTGSCPCQPFSAAGKGLGFADERHLWPAWFHLIRECKPERIFGEQASSPGGLAWLDLVQADLESEGYAGGGVDTCAAGFGAPHIRQRLYWMAHADSGKRDGLTSRQERISNRKTTGWNESDGELERHSKTGGMANTNSSARGQGGKKSCGSNQGGDAQSRAGSSGCYSTDRMEHADSNGCTRSLLFLRWRGQNQADSEPTRPSQVNGFWHGADWLYGQDERWRPVEPGTFPLAHGPPARVGRLRAYGNAINAHQAAEFIAAAMEVMP